MDAGFQSSQSARAAGSAASAVRFGQGPQSAGFHGAERPATLSVSRLLDGWVARVTACPWGAHAGLSPWGAQAGPARRGVHAAGGSSPRRDGQLYSVEERARRDASPWTMVQGVLAPLQFLVCAVSLILILRYLATGQGYAVATGSILLKTVALYAIMITGSIWEKQVFGRWLFAPAFFWEDAVSMLVLALQTTYVAALLAGWGSPAQQMTIAVAAYAAYAVNASQFLLKLRAARLATAPRTALAA